MQARRTTASAVGPRRWLRFSLRGMFAVMTVLAVWLGYQVNSARTQRYAISQLQALDGVVEIEYDWQYDEQGNAREPSWWRLAVGDHLFSRVTAISFFSDSIADCPDIDGLTIGDLAIDVSDDDLAILRQFPHLQGLYLHDTNITDAGLVHIKNLHSLKYLSLQRTRITDAGLAHLQTLTNLQYLLVDQCGVTADGAAMLRRALPNTVIFPVSESESESEADLRRPNA